MKKLPIILIMSIILLTACAPKPPAVSTPNPAPSPAPVKADVRDKSALHQYIQCEIADVSWDQFAQWEMLYCDITGGGTEEVVLVSPNVEWHNKVEIITAAGGQFRRIVSDIPLGKYSNVVTYEDGFLVVRASTGGPGEHIVVMNLYAFSNSEMTNVLDGLVVEHTVSFQTADYEERAEFVGDTLRGFIYILTRHDNLTNKTYVVKKERYIYDPYSASFFVRPLATAQEEGKLYLHQLSNGDSVGRGLTIEDIDFKHGRNEAAFTLSGELEVQGSLHWDDKDGDGLIFSVAESEILPVIVVEGVHDTIEYSPRILRFRNNDSLEELLSVETVEGIKTGRSLNAVMTVTNIKVGFRMGTCAGGTYVTFVSMGQ